MIASEQDEEYPDKKKKGKKGKVTKNKGVEEYKGANEEKGDSEDEKQTRTSINKKDKKKMDSAFL
jgi:hypothetical protein